MGIIVIQKGNTVNMYQLTWLGADSVTHPVLSSCVLTHQEPQILPVRTLMHRERDMAPGSSLHSLTTRFTVLPWMVSCPGRKPWKGLYGPLKDIWQSLTCTLVNQMEKCELRLRQSIHYVGRSLWVSSLTLSSSTASSAVRWNHIRA